MKKFVILLLTLTLPVVLISSNKTVKAYQSPPTGRIGFTRAISTVPNEEFIIFGKNDMTTPDINSGLTIKMFQQYFVDELVSSGVDYMDWPITWDSNGFKLYIDGSIYSDTRVALVRYNYANALDQYTLFFDINFNLIVKLSPEDVSTANSIELKRYTQNYDSYSVGYTEGYNAGVVTGEITGYNNGRNDFGILYNGQWRDAIYYGNIRYSEGINASNQESYDAGYIDGSKDSFMASIEKWIVPAIFIVIVVGGFFALRGRREN